MALLLSKLSFIIDEESFFIMGEKLNILFIRDMIESTKLCQS